MELSYTINDASQDVVQPMVYQRPLNKQDSMIEEMVSRDIFFDNTDAQDLICENLYIAVNINNNTKMIGLVKNTNVNFLVEYKKIAEIMCNTTQIVKYDWLHTLFDK